MDKTKETIATWSALGMLIFGVLITTAGFIVPPLGEVHGSVLWILGQVLIYSGSILGIAAYTQHVVKSLNTDNNEDSDSGNGTRQ